MNAIRVSNQRRYLPLLTIAVAAASLCAPAFGLDVGKLAPKDTLFLLSAPNVSAATKRFKKTSAYAMYKDPSMQGFVQPTEKKVMEEIRKKLREAWSKIEMEGEAKIPWPQGAAALLFRLESKTVKVPVRRPASEGGEAGEQTVTEYREETRSEPRFLMIGEMGDNLALTKRLAERQTEKQVSEGYQRRRRTVRGVEVTTLRKPAKADSDKAGAEGSEDDKETVAYAFREGTILFSNDEKFLTDVLARMSGAEAASLSDDEGYRATFRALGEGDAAFYLNIKRLIEMAMADVPQGGRAQVERMIRVLGVENLESLGCVFQIAPRANEDMRLKVLLKMQGQRAGIPAALVPPAMSTEPSRLLTEGVASFVVANYDIGKMFEQITKMVREAAGIDIAIMAQNAMGQTAGVGGEQPVDLQMDVFNQFRGPLTFVSRVRKPYTSEDSSQMRLAIGVRDGSILEAALGRIIDTFLARGGKEHRREIRGKNVFVLPLPIPLPTGGSDGPPKVAVTVAGGNLVVASVDGAEQVIRDLDRKDVRSVRTDPMYQHAARALPARASIYFYVNQQIDSAVTWARLKEAARKVADSPDSSPSQREVRVGFPLGTAMLTPMVKQLKEYCDFTTLPEFESVRKHFGATIGYVTGTEEGIRFEMVSLKAPPQ